MVEDFQIDHTAQRLRFLFYIDIGVHLGVRQSRLSWIDGTHQ